jgi:hypothetical protein
MWYPVLHNTLLFQSTFAHAECKISLKKERWILAGYTHYLELGSACISQLLCLDEGCIGFYSAAKILESNALAVPGLGIVGI